MIKQTQAQSATSQVDVVTPAFGPLPAIYVPLRLRRPARSVKPIRKPTR